MIKKNTLVVIVKSGKMGVVKAVPMLGSNLYMVEYKDGNVGYFREIELKVLS
jgi:hypothetical protein